MITRFLLFLLILFFFSCNSKKGSEELDLSNSNEFCLMDYLIPRNPISGIHEFVLDRDSSSQIFYWKYKLDVNPDRLEIQTFREDNFKLKSRHFQLYCDSIILQKEFVFFEDYSSRRVDRPVNYEGPYFSLDKPTTYTYSFVNKNNNHLIAIQRTKDSIYFDVRDLILVDTCFKNLPLMVVEGVKKTKIFEIHEQDTILIESEVLNESSYYCKGIGLIEVISRSPSGEYRFFLRTILPD